MDWRGQFGFQSPRTRAIRLVSTFWTPAMLSLSTKVKGSFFKGSPFTGRSQSVRSYTRETSKSSRKPLFGAKASVASFALSHLRSGSFQMPSIATLPQALQKNVRFHGSSAASANSTGELYVTFCIANSGLRFRKYRPFPLVSIMRPSNESIPREFTEPRCTGCSKTER